MQVIQALNAFDINLLGTLGPSLNISEWVHEATQGRDHYVRIVYEGVLYPCRHRAALVKITERKIADVNGSPVAFLAQRMFIVVRQPEVDYDEDRGVDAKYGRRMPLRRLRLTRLVTPDIDKPQPFAGEYTFKIFRWRSAVPLSDARGRHRPPSGGFERRDDLRSAERPHRQALDSPARSSDLPRLVRAAVPRARSTGDLRRASRGRRE